MLHIEGLSKSYGETKALRAATIAFEAGTVHAILGENGSGKSTLVKLLSGIVTPDHGTITFDGATFAGREPRAFQVAGLATVFQEVLVAPDLSVAENILLGIDRPTRWVVRQRDRKRVAGEALAKFATTQVRLDVEAGTLPLAARQLVVLARAVVRSPRVLILDEVTAALDFADRASVFKFVRGLADAGCLIIFITHRMDEVMELSDRLSILRNGQVVRTEACGESSAAELLRAMAPETAEELGPGTEP